MADKFECDQCKDLMPVRMKRGRLILQELKDGQTHMSYYNRKAEVCERCFDKLRNSMNHAVQRPTLGEATELAMVNVKDD